MPGRTVVTIGNFDGAHSGHQALIRAARQAAGDAGRIIAMVFDPHPATVLRPDAVPARLTSLPQRTRLLRDLGVDEVVPLQPTPELLGTCPESFISGVNERQQPAAMVEGPDFRFGKDRAGDVRLLKDLGLALGFEVIIVPPAQAVLSDHTLVTVSSSLVRWLLEHGRVDDARRLLGRPYEVQGEVLRGDQRGRVLGVPTVNLLPETILPADGVYFGRASDPQGQWLPAAINVGAAPTFAGGRRRCEAHLIDGHWPLDTYGWTCTVQFEGFLRNELRFDGVESVRRQIGRDIDRSRDLLARHALAS